MNDMTRDAWIIISTGVANALVSAGLVITLFLWLRAELHSDIADLRADMAELRTEVRADLAEMRTEMAEMRADIDNIKERLIRLEVIVERAHPPLITMEPPAPPVPS
ncbi:MAG: hypothetical protein OXJ53_03485 [Gammaproteobacteria bacterium]|nr:hypothetical protein [Gammaproteobacteria bacterium]MDE0270342.1 hypothetical protein [Gammaproteobacteria bacterium]